MKLILLTPVLGAAITSAFTVSPSFSTHAITIQQQLSIPHSRLHMSDSQPSDSSSEELYDTVDVESTDYVPSESESIVNSILDQIPMELTGDMSKGTRSKINEALIMLEAVNPTEEPTTSPLLNGVWSLKYAGGYSSEWALASPTRQLALFLYSGGYSPGLFALSLAQRLPAAICEPGDLTISISREQPRIEAKIDVKFLGGAENKIVVKSSLNVESPLRFTETYESGSAIGQMVEFPNAVQYSRELLITYLDEDLLVVRDASGVPEILVRKKYGA